MSKDQSSRIYLSRHPRDILSRPNYQPNQALFYQLPESGKLAVVSFVSYAIAGPHRGLPVVYNRATQLNEAVDPDRLYTGTEDKPEGFWDNLEQYPEDRIDSTVLIE